MFLDLSMAAAVSDMTDINPLLHSTIYTDEKKVAVSLPFTEELRHYHSNGSYPLLEDPLSTKRAAVVGMFVLRPATVPLVGDINSAADTQQLIYNPSLDWIFNVNGVDGGGLISNCHAVDGYRLAMQYALSDAVIFGSNIAANDGVSTAATPGYLWQGYNVCEWGHIKAIDPELNDKLLRNRQVWQKLGYLSDRKYPAQIVFTKTGQHYENGNYFLQARIFQEPVHPTGEEIEVYIFTSEAGAAVIRSKAESFGVSLNRIESMLVILPPPPSTPLSVPLPSAAQQSSAPNALDLCTEVDVAIIPTLLYERFNMRIINHDGGHDLLHEFYHTGSLCQMNITLCRNKSVKSVLETWPYVVSENERKAALDHFDNRIRYFFKKEKQEEQLMEKSSDYCYGIPSHITFANVITDAHQDLAIVTFDCNKTKYYTK